MDKEQSLEDEIQLRERIQLQCKQAERAVEDLQMELNTLTQTRDDLSKQLKVTQVKHAHFHEILKTGVIIIILYVYTGDRL